MIQKLGKKIVEETSHSGSVRVLYKNDNYTSFFDKNDKIIESEKRTTSLLYYPNPCCYVTLPVDLKLLNFPKNYVVSFSIIDSLKTKKWRIVCN